MILIFGAENEPNIPLLIDILNHRKKSWCRINGEDFPKKIKVDFEIGKSSNVTFANSFKRKDIIDLSTVKAVWNRRRGNIDPPHELQHGHRLFIKDEIVAVKMRFIFLILSIYPANCPSCA